MWIKLKPYIISVLIALGVGALSAWFTKGNMDIYPYVAKPRFAPPMAVFPIVWTILFILMGIGSAMIYKAGINDGKDVSGALRLYGLQLIINFFWSIIFFNMRAYLFAFIWLLLLWAAVIAMTFKFHKINKKAAYLQFPYLLWIKFAGYLNLMIYILNR
ncbi:MAG: tryptophan-rich sensory protein [Clostridiales bacterium]|nr:tryptophan-rich sensory protein [Clostridiales bacterium]